MPIDIESFKKYGKLAQYVCNKQDGKVTAEKLRDLIGAEFDTINKETIERHYQNLLIANFFSPAINGLKAAKIDWEEFERKIQDKKKEIMEQQRDLHE